MHNFLYTFLFVLHRKAGVSAYLYNEITVSKGLNLVFDISLTITAPHDIILYSIVYKNLITYSHYKCPMNFLQPVNPFRENDSQQGIMVDFMCGHH